MRGYSVAIVGATGLVGRTMLTILAERNFPISTLSLFASKASIGKQLRFHNKSLHVQELKEDSFENIEIALFSAGSAVSHHFAPFAAKAGTVAIDNSSQWRLAHSVPLIVPEINPKAMKNIRGKLASHIIANPNCSTIQLVMALKPLHDRYKMKRVVVSTYQSVTGGGHRAEEQLMKELLNQHVEHPFFPKPIAFNTVFHSMPYADGYSQEEFKMIHETRKILDVDGLPITATCVRIPVTGGHSESVNVEFERGFTLDAVRKSFEGFPGIVVQDDPENNVYPTPLTCHGKDDVFVGRIRKDTSVKNGLNFWVVSDNLRKGAATNAVQIAEKLIEMKLI